LVQFLSLLDQGNARPNKRAGRGGAFFAVAAALVPLARDAHARATPGARLGVQRADRWRGDQAPARDGAGEEFARALCREKYLSIVNTPLEYTGSLAYTAPDKLEKRTETPKPEKHAAGGGKLTLTNANRQTRVVMLAQYPQVRAFTESIRSVLAGDFNALARYYNVKGEGNIEQWTLLLEPMRSIWTRGAADQFSGANHSIVASRLPKNRVTLGDEYHEEAP